jgi:signal transduction histidine kinase
VQSKDGSNLHILADAARIFGEDGKPRKVTFVVDVTKEKAVQEKLEQEVQRASSLEKVRDNVDSMIRHDLRNPLNGIMGSCQLLLEDQEVLPEDSLELVKLIYASSQKLKGLLDTTVDLVRLEQGNFDLQLEPEDIPEIVSVGVQELEFLATTLGVEVRFEAPFDWEPCLVHKTLFQSMVSNLLRNGIEASRPGETVTIELEKEYDGVVPGFTIHVHNRGVIPAELNAHIFGERVNSKKHGGSGIGTYLVGLAVRAHGGTIRYSSDQQRGTRIHVWIPNQPR